mmetsp:Transcript_20716/g.64012  ORF Transcript_20716/g.64012 Transcript_20716/m.64012 type:complete len:209 (-) Transcript_20716:551-1177(-)
MPAPSKAMPKARISGNEDAAVRHRNWTANDASLSPRSRRHFKFGALGVEQQQPLVRASREDFFLWFRLVPLRPIGLVTRCSLTSEPRRCESVRDPHASRRWSSSSSSPSDESSSTSCGSWSSSPTSKAASSGAASTSRAAWRRRTTSMTSFLARSEALSNTCFMKATRNATTAADASDSTTPRNVVASKARLRSLPRAMARRGPKNIE